MNQTEMHHHSTKQYFFGFHNFALFTRKIITVHKSKFSYFIHENQRLDHHRTTGGHLKIYVRTVQLLMFNWLMWKFSESGSSQNPNQKITNPSTTAAVENVMYREIQTRRDETIANAAVDVVRLAAGSHCTDSPHTVWQSFRDEISLLLRATPESVYSFGWS